MYLIILVDRIRDAESSIQSSESSMLVNNLQLSTNGWVRQNLGTPGALLLDALILDSSKKKWKENMHGGEEGVLTMGVGYKMRTPMFRYLDEILTLMDKMPTELGYQQTSVFEEDMPSTGLSVFVENTLMGNKVLHMDIYRRDEGSPYVE